MNRRTYFVATGSAVFGGLAGCLGSDEYPTESFGGVDVSLASLEVEAPDYSRELTLEELTSDVVTA